MIFEIRAFLPLAISDAACTPLTGVDALFFRAEGTNPAEAYKKFLSHDFIKLELDTLLEKDHTLFIQPKACTGALVYPIPEDAPPVEDNTVLPTKAYLRRVK